jgi:hypothetical protein
LPSLLLPYSVESSRKQAENQPSTQEEKWRVRTQQGSGVYRRRQIRTIEIHPQPHIHAALVAVAPLDCTHAALLWRAMVAPRYAAAAIVEPYKDDLCGLGYVLKQLGGSTQEPKFSENIRAFAPGSGKSLFRTNSAQRRQVCRIKAAMVQAVMPGNASFQRNERGD